MGDFDIMNLDEKRRDRRLDLDVTLELSRVDEADGVTTVKLLHVDVTDLSHGGIGFVANQELQVGSIYNTKLQIWTKEVIDAFIKIARCDKTADGYSYGATFVGMIESDALKIDIYQIIYEHDENMKA